MPRVITLDALRGSLIAVSAAFLAGCGGGDAGSDSQATASAHTLAVSQTPAFEVATAAGSGCNRAPVGLTPLYPNPKNSKGQILLGGKPVPAEPQTECTRDVSTVQGQDVNRNFIRDDVERAIAFNYGARRSQTAYNAAMRYAFYLQTAQSTWAANLGRPVGSRIGTKVQEVLNNLHACWAVEGLMPASILSTERLTVIDALSNVRKWMGDTQGVPELGIPSRSDAYLAVDQDAQEYGKNKAFDLDTLVQGCRLALRDAPSLISQDGRTNILYINGIRTDFEAAIKGAVDLRNAIEGPPLPRVKRSTGVRVFFFHNPMNWGGAGDLAELSSTKVNEENYVGLYRRLIRPDALNPHQFVDQAREVLQYLNNESPRIINAVNYVDSYFLPGVAAGGRLVVVAHSQGNTIAQWFYLRAMSKSTEADFKRIRIVNVANVMRISPNGLDVTSAEDNVIFGQLPTLGKYPARSPGTAECPFSPFGCAFKTRKPTVTLSTAGFVNDGWVENYDPFDFRVWYNHYFSETYLGLGLPGFSLFRPTQELAANASLPINGQLSDGIQLFSDFQPLRNRVVDTIYTALDAVETTAPPGFRVLPGFQDDWLAGPGVSVEAAGDIVLSRSPGQRPYIVSRAAYPGTELKASWSGCLGVTRLSYQWAGLSFNGRDGLLSFHGSAPAMRFFTRWESPGVLWFEAFKGDFDATPNNDYNQLRVQLAVPGAVAGAGGICGDFVMGVHSSPIDGKRRGYAFFKPETGAVDYTFQQTEIEMPPGILRVDFGGYDAEVRIRNLVLDTSCSSASLGATSCYLNSPRDR